jgi:hypothetical protein
MAEGLIDGAAFAVDGSLIAADANKQRSAAGSDEVDWQALARTRRSVEATRAIGQAEVGAARTMIERTEECLWLGGDAGMAGQRAGDRAAHSGVRQVGPHQRHSEVRSLPPQPATRSTRESGLAMAESAAIFKVFVRLSRISGLSNTATLARIRRKSPARTAEIPVFVETIGGERFDRD